MADANQPAVQTNEFGSPVVPGQADVALNQQGKETTLEDILNAVRGVNNGDKPTTAAPATDAPTTDSKDPVVDAPKDINTGNKALDIAISSFARSTGASDEDMQRACKAALDYGDVALIDKAFIAERFKERGPEALAIAEAVVEQAGLERDRMVQSVYSIAGDEAQWKTALGVYKQHAPAGLQKALQMMFDSGDAESVKDAAKLVVDFAKGSGALVVAGGRTVAGSGPADAQGLSMQEFQSAIGKLNQSSRSYTQDYKRLFELRRIGKQLGK